MNGWTQWGTHPASKFHYFIEDKPGHHLSACEQYGLIRTKKDLHVKPPERKRCKVCLNMMPSSGEEATET